MQYGACLQPDRAPVSQQAMAAPFAVQTVMVCTGVSAALSSVLVFYSVLLDDGFVFLISLSLAIVQTVVACTPSIDAPREPQPPGSTPGSSQLPPPAVKPPPQQGPPFTQNVFQKERTDGKQPPAPPGDGTAKTAARFPWMSRGGVTYLPGP